MPGRELLRAAIGGRKLKRMRIFAGYGKSRELFGANNGEKVVLKDHFGWQDVALPKRLPGQFYWAGDDTPVSIKILVVYPGTRYQDTCISEVELVLR